MTILNYRETCAALRGLAPRLAARPEMRSAWEAAGMSVVEAGECLDLHFAREARPAVLGDLVRARDAMSPTDREALDRATHRFDGRSFEALRPIEKHKLLHSDGARYRAMRRDWESRGKPLAPEAPTLLAAIGSLARSAGLDLSEPAPARRHLEVVH